MDLITQTSLEALLLKATNFQNQNPDTAAVEAFCALINQEKDGPQYGVKIIAQRLTAANEKELLQTLNMLDTCMAKCGSQFQSEIGKFRFLNEMIKLVSPKYLGAQTPLSVKQKVLQLMYIWTLDYPKETKIKEAYEMLRKQGVIREIPNPNITIPKKPSSVFHDEEKSKILQKLLQSKDPEDIQAANWLIKSMVKEDDKRAELKSRRVSELESVQNNVRLLNEMLDSFKPGVSSSDELDLIRELHQSCERLKPNLIKLAGETPQNEELLSDVLQASDELGLVFGKFHSVMAGAANGSPHSLLDFEGPTASAVTSDTKTKENQIDVLCDIFNAANIPESVDILKPTTVLNCDTSSIKMGALEDLDALSEQIFKENLPGGRPGGFNNRNHEKIPMNLLPKLSDTKDAPAPITLNGNLNLDLNFLLKPKEELKSVSLEDSGDDFLVDLSDEKMLGGSDEPSEKPLINDKMTEPAKLTDVSITLDEVKPSSKAPLTILNDRNGITVTLHFVKDKPRDDVAAFVVTTISKNKLALSNYLFQAVVPKSCKLKLQAASSTVLPAFNPFLPPSAITQIMLIASRDAKVCLKFIVSFVMDEETCTEMGEIENLSLN